MARQMGFGAGWRRAAAVAAVTAVIIGCAPAPAASTPPSGGPGSSASAVPSPTIDTAPGGSVVIVGRIVTMAERPVAEALFIEGGMVAAVGGRDEVVALAGDDVPVVDIGANVAYPGFIDAHAHWIGDRNYYGLETPADAMAAAAARGWTSISEQWVDDEKLAELEGLAEDGALSLRVDAYLALNGVHPGEMYGDWYADREPGAIDDRLRVKGLKIHLDTGTGAVLLWAPDDLTGAIGRADAAGWQVSVHTVSTEAMALVLEAFEGAIGPSGPNPLHHRVEHALQVTDGHLARLAAMDLVPVIQLDGAPYDWVVWAASPEAEHPRDLAAEDLGWLARWKDFLHSGLHVAATTDAPWFFPGLALTDGLARPMDQIAGAMDGRGREFPETPDWMLDQLLTAEQGLAAVTTGAAWAIGDEGRRGHLAVGTLGDVTILSGDVLGGATADEIRALQVIATIVGGALVFCAEADICSQLED